MNVVLDEAVEVYVKDAKPKRELGACYTKYHYRRATDTPPGRILLKGDNITLIQQIV